MLDCWTDEHGLPAGPQLLDRLLGSAGPRACVVLAEPGSGKTTLLGQLVHAYAEAAPEGPAPVVLEFAQFFHRMSWWSIGEELADTAEKILDASPSSGTLFMDVPLPRLRSALERLAARPDTLLVGLVADPRVQEKAVRVRTELRSRRGAAEDVRDILARHDMATDLADAQVIPATFGMGSPEIVHYSGMESLSEARVMARVGLTRPDDVRLPDGAAGLDESLQERYRLKIAHMRHYLADGLGLPPERRCLLLGSYVRDRPVHWLQATINRYSYHL